MMELSAQEAEKTGRIRVVVQSFRINTSMSRGAAVMVKLGKAGFIHLFLPKYCLEMNLIELEWQHLKKDELSKAFV